MSLSQVIGNKLNAKLFYGKYCKLHTYIMLFNLFSKDAVSFRGHYISFSLGSTAFSSFLHSTWHTHTRPHKLKIWFLVSNFSEDDEKGQFLFQLSMWNNHKSCIIFNFIMVYAVMTNILRFQCTYFTVMSLHMKI